MNYVSSKQRDPYPNTNSFIRKKHATNVEWSPLYVEVSFLIKECSLGYGPLSLLLILCVCICYKS